MFTRKLTHMQKNNMEKLSHFFFTQIVKGFHHKDKICIAYVRVRITQERFMKALGLVRIFKNKI